MKTRLYTNTQKNESVNRTLTTTNPKFSTWTVTLPGRAHGAVLRRNCGVFQLIKSRCKAAGAELDNKLVTRQLKQIQNRTDYHKERKDSQEYKDRQSYLRRVRYNNQEVAAESMSTYQKKHSGSRI